MILGIGSDLCDIRRIETSLARFGERFTHRIFTEGERAKSDRRATRAESYARRFAAKGGLLEGAGHRIAVGRVLARYGGGQSARRRPTLKLTGGAAERLKAMTPEGFEAIVHVTMTDEPPLAQAFVVIEARAKRG